MQSDIIANVVLQLHCTKGKVIPCVIIFHTCGNTDYIVQTSTNQIRSTTYFADPSVLWTRAFRNTVVARTTGSSVTVCFFIVVSVLRRYNKLLTLSYLLTLYGVIMVMISPQACGNLYGEFNTRRCNLAHDFCCFLWVLKS